MSEDGHFRGSSRPQAAVEVRIHRLWATSPEPLPAYTRDIGIGGAFVVTDECLERGERVRLVLAAPTAWQPLAIEAEVAWWREGGDQGPAGVGMRFVAPDDDQAVALRDLVAALDFEG
jgi:uncharacterized protein (TIGR02266 family)